MSNVLLLIAHPNYKKSLGVGTIVSAVQDLPHVEIRDLFALYPNYQIDFKAEQEALAKADLIILQYPMYWYNMPALLKQWFDTVLTYGFAFGSTNQLQNKTIMASVTAGAQKSTFAEDELKGIFVTIKSTAKYCGLIYQAPIISFGINFKPNGTKLENASALQSVQAHAQDLKSFIINYKH